MSARRRIAVTGLGVTSPFGRGVEALWSGVSAGRSAAVPLSLFDPADLPVRFACEVPAVAERGPGARVTRFVHEAAEEAWSSARLSASVVEPDRAGVVLALGHLGPETGWFVEDVEQTLALGRALDDAAGVERLLETLVPQHGGLDAVELGYFPQLLAAAVARRCGISGGAGVVTTSCPGSLQALICAAAAIQDGEADLMLAGGGESLIHPFGMMSFARMQALSTNNEEHESASRPFDRRRDGFVMGEGAGLLVLEEWEHALRRGAPIHAEWLGSGLSCDAYRLSDEHPEGISAVAAVLDALREADTAPEQIGYVNAHGSSTPMNDRTETMVLHKALGAHARRVPVSSTKSMIGHLIHASAAVEIVTTIRALQEQLVPPTAHLRVPDPQCDLDYVPLEARAHRHRRALKTSFGFGGVNAAVVLGAAE